jgi:hypothetical protein
VRYWDDCSLFCSALRMNCHSFVCWTVCLGVRCDLSRRWSARAAQCYCQVDMLPVGEGFGKPRTRWSLTYLFRLSFRLFEARLWTLESQVSSSGTNTSDQQETGPTALPNPDHDQRPRHHHGHQRKNNAFFGVNHAICLGDQILLLVVTLYYN